MLDFYDVIVIGGIFCSFITSLLLFTQGRYQLHANRLLSIVLFAFGWYAFSFLLIQTGWMKNIPVIFRVGSPLYYLVPPCAYLYIRSVIRDEDRFRKRDWLHFLPALLHFLELLPFYFSDAETKRQAIQAVTESFNDAYDKGSGLIPMIWHYILRPLQGLVYLVFIWGLLTRSLGKKHHFTISAGIFDTIKKWLIVFAGFITILYAGLAFETVSGLIRIYSSVPVIIPRGNVHMVMALVFFLLSIYLFFKPGILYGTLTTAITLPVAKPGEIPAMARNRPAPVQQEGADPKETTLLNEELVLTHARKIEEHLLAHQSFRKQGITITQLAVELAMPMHHLSYVLNYHYKQRFTDFINQYRVDYVRQLLKEEEWQKLKLETLAMEAGFSARSTFFSTFKKMTGLTPVEYTRQTGTGRTIPDEQLN